MVFAAELVCRVPNTRWPVSAAVSARRMVSRSRSSPDRKSTRLNSSHSQISYAVFCLKKKKNEGLSIDPNYPRVMEPTGLTRFLFELASDERLGILDAIADTPLRHAQIARHLKMTDSETTRHLNRLASTGLLMKNAQSQYEPTNLARLVSAGFPFFRFLLKNRDFLLKHDVRVLPSEFVERLGALTGGTFVNGMYDVAAAQVRYLRAVKHRIWVLTDQMFEQAIPILREKATMGADVRVIRSREGFEREIARLPPVERNYPVR